MIGLFEQQNGFENLPMADFLGDSAPALLFPFLREAFANITTRGRFGPVWLQPDQHPHFLGGLQESSGLWH